MWGVGRIVSASILTLGFPSKVAAMCGGSGLPGNSGFIDTCSTLACLISVWRGVTSVQSRRSWSLW